MKHPFTSLTKSDVQILRNKPMAIPSGSPGVNYNFTSKEIDDAVKHLMTLYTGVIRSSFATKILILNEIY